MVGVGRHFPPASEIAHQFEQCIARSGRQFVGVADRIGRCCQRDALSAGEAMDLLDRLVAEAALGCVDYALEGEIVRGLGNHPQIGEGVADFGALVEAEAADDLVGHADRDEAVFELAGLELGADQNRDIVERHLMELLQRLDLVAGAAGFFRAVPDADHLHLVALGLLGPQRLAEAAAVVVDQGGGSGEDMRGGAVILL